MFAVCECVLNAPNDPNEDIACKNSCKGERNTNAQEIFCCNSFAILSQDTDCCNVCRCTDRSEVAAESCTAKQTEIEYVRFHACAAVHHCGNTLYNGEHSCNIGNVVDECRKYNGSEYNKGIKKERTIACDTIKERCDSIDNTCGLDAFNYHKEAEKEQESIFVEILDDLFERLGIVLDSARTGNADYAHDYADKTASVIIEGKKCTTVGRFTDEGSNYKQNNSANQHISGEEIVDNGLNFGGNGLLILAEEDQQNNDGDK